MEAKDIVHAMSEVNTLTSSLEVVLIHITGGGLMLFPISVMLLEQHHQFLVRVVVSITDQTHQLPIPLSTTNESYQFQFWITCYLSFVPDLPNIKKRFVPDSISSRNEGSIRCLWFCDESWGTVH